jgi:hypothetical protein
MQVCFRSGIAVALLWSTTSAAFAHHAWNEIDTAKTFKLVGKVLSLKWENPHTSLVLETDDGGGPVRWTVWMSGIARNEGHGIKADTVAVGKTLTIVASPSREEPHAVRANRIESDGEDHELY